MSKRVEMLCDMCYEGGVDKEVFVAMTEYFLLNMADPPPVVIRHIDYLTEQETMRATLDDANKEWGEKENAERELIAEMKKEYLMKDCPSWRRLEIQQDLSTYNELVPNLPFDDE